MDPLDFSRFFLTWTRKPEPLDYHQGWGNSVRIALDARVRLIDESSGAQEDFYLIAPCRSEWMYREDELFKVPSTEYRLAWARDRALQFSPRLTDANPSPTVQPNSDRFLSLDLHLTPLRSPRRLASDDDVVDAARTTVPVVAQTQIADRDRGRRALLEYPVMTLNYHPEHQRFQVDTGPLLWADLSSAESDWIRWLRLAHVVYNRFDRAEFVKRTPTPVVSEGREVCLVEDYQDIHSQDASHVLYAGG